MSSFPFAPVLAVLLLTATLHAQENPSQPTALGAETTAITSKLADGTPAAPTPAPELPEFTIKSTTTRLIDVVEPPPLPGLPPVTGTITATVHLVENPGLPDPPPPSAKSPAASTPPRTIREAAPLVRTASITATVYDHSTTLLRWRTGADASAEMTAWSNLDFNHFTGFTTCQVKAPDGEIRRYRLAIRIDPLSRLAEVAALRRGTTYQPPAHPALPDLQTHGPAFVVTTGDTSDGKAVELLEDLHQLYRVEGTRMAAAHEARLAAQVQRRADLLAHPPKPEDVTVYFWDRDHPAPVTTPATQGATP